jgi:ABC-2 type transport system permease protein
MRNVWIIARREYKQYFTSPVFYAVAFAIFVILGIIFYSNILAAVFQQMTPGIQIVVGPMVTLFLFTIPAITMRSLAEELKSGTLELLLTAPVRDWELVVGKWLGGVLFVLTIIAATLIYPLMLNQMVTPGIDQGMMIAAYLGLLLLTSTFIAIGVACSSMFSNQIAAFFVTIGIFLILWMVSYPAQVMGQTAGGEVLKYLDISEHFFSSFYMGIIEIKDIVYYISLISFALLFGTVSVETRRWR